MSWNMFSRFGDGSDSDMVGFGELEKAIGTNARTAVDLREPHEFVAGHIPNALNMPMSGFDPRELPQGKPVVTRARLFRRQAVVGAVSTHRAEGGVDDERGNQADGAIDARAIAFAPSAAMFGPDAGGDALPESGGDGQEALPDARRGKGQRRAPR